VIQSFITIFNFTASTYRIIPWANSYLTQVYFNFVFVPVQSFCYLYGSLLNILILIDRISYFNKKVKDMVKLGAYKTSGIALVISLVINMPVFFAFRPHAAVSMLNATTSVTIYSTAPSEFSLTPLGTALTFIIFALRDVLIMIVLIVLNAVSTWILRDYFVKRTKLLRGVANLVDTRSNQPATDVTNTVQVALKSRSSIAQAAATDTSRSNAKREQRVAVMAILICFIEVCNHGITFACDIYPYFYFDIIAFILYSLSNLFLPASALADFFIFYFFNKNFKKVCLGYFNMQSGE
jgi:hypothetical protein